MTEHALITWLSCTDLSLTVLVGRLGSAGRVLLGQGSLKQLLLFISVSYNEVTTEVRLI